MNDLDFYLKLEVVFAWLSPSTSEKKYSLSYVILNL